MSDFVRMFEFDEYKFSDEDDKYDDISYGREKKKGSRKGKSSYEHSMPRGTIFITDSGAIYKNEDKNQRAEKAKATSNSTKFDRDSKYAPYNEVMRDKTTRDCRCADIIDNPPLSCEDVDYIFSVCCGCCINDRCRFCLKLTENAGPCDECLRFMKQNPGIVWYSYW
jgi:hypothetical protein